MSRSVQLFVIAALLGGLAVPLFYSAFHAEQREFEKKLSVGLPKLEVEELVGSPAEVLVAGDSLSLWGNHTVQQVETETWVYYLFPKSVHRYVLTFNDSTLIRIEAHRN